MNPPRPKNSILPLIAALLFPLLARAAEKTTPIPVAPLARTTTVDFQDEILPILRTSCLACHNRTTTKSGLILETPQTILKGNEDGPVVIPGKSAESRLLDLAAHQDKPVMPPRDNKASAPNLTGEQLALLKLWIDQGAKGEVRNTAIHWQSIARTFTPAYAVAITQDAQFAAVGRANELDLYHLPSQKLLPPLFDATLSKSAPLAHRDMIYSLAFSPDGNRLASGSFGEIKIWRRQTTTAKIMFTNATAGLATASPDGKLLALANDKNEIQIADATTGKITKTLPANSTPIHLLRFSSDSTRLASATEKSLKIWNLNDATSSPELPTPSEIKSLAWILANKQLAAGHTDTIIRTYKLSEAAPLTLTPAAELKGHTAPVTALDTITPGNQLLSGSTDGTLKIWNLDNNQPIRQMSHGAPITSVAARPDGKQLASTSENGTAKLWDTTKGTLIADLKGDRALLQTATEKNATAKLAAADTTYFKSVLTKSQADLKAQEDRVKKAAEAKLVADKPVPEKETAYKTATDVKTKADAAVTAATAEQKKRADALTAAEKAQKDLDQRLAGSLASRVQPPPPSEKPQEKPTTSATPELESLKTQLATATKQVTETKAAQTKSQASLKSATEAQTAATKTQTTTEDALKVAQRVQANAANEVTLANAAVSRITASITAQQATITKSEQQQHEAETQSTTATQQASAPQKPLRVIAFSPDNATLATAGDNQTINLWSTDSLAPLQTIEAHTAPIATLSFTNSNTLLSTATNNTANLWNLSPQWTLERTIGSGDANSTLSDRVNALAFSPDGQTLASGSGEPSRGGEIKLWDINNGNLLHDFKDIHSDAVLCLDFSHDGKRLASGAADRFVKIIDLTTNKMILALEGHTHHVLAVSFKADGRTLASTGADGQIKIWDLVAGERKATVPPFTTEVTAIHFLGISDQAVLTAADGQVRVINEAGGTVRTATTPPDHIHAATISQDGKTLISSGQSGSLYLFDAAAGKLITTFPPPQLP